VSISLILLCLLGAWWLLLTVFVVRCYLERVRDAKTPLTPEEIEDCRKLEAETRMEMGWRDGVTLAPFIFVFWLFLLPLLLYECFLKFRDPYDAQIEA